MEVYERVAPTGKRFKVTAASEADADKTFADFMQTDQYKATIPVADAPGMLRAAESGIREGFEGLLGQFGDINELSGAFTEWIATKMGATPERARLGRQIGSKLTPFQGMPTTEDVQSVTGKIIGAPYETQNEAEERVKRMSSFAPAMLSPGSAARRVASAALPAVGSEAAGALAETAGAAKYADVARLLGAISAGSFAVGSPNVSTRRASRKAARGAPTAEQARTNVNNLYQQMRNAGISYNPKDFQNTIDEARRNLRTAGFTRSIAEPVYRYLDDLEQQIPSGLDFDEVEGFSQRIGGFARDARRAQNEQLAKAFDILDSAVMDFEQNAPFRSQIPISPTDLNTIRGEARKAALQNIKNRVLQRVIDDADTFASGDEAAIRNRIGVLLRSPKGRQLFPPNSAERRILSDVQQGRKGIRNLSKFGVDFSQGAPNDVRSAAVSSLLVGGGGAGLYGGADPVTALAGALTLGGAGTAAKAYSPRATRSALDDAMASIRSGKTAGSAGLENLTAADRERLVRALLISDVSATQANNE